MVEGAIPICFQSRAVAQRALCPSQFAQVLERNGVPISEASIRDSEYPQRYASNEIDDVAFKIRFSLYINGFQCF